MSKKTMKKIDDQIRDFLKESPKATIKELKLKFPLTPEAQIRYHLKDNIEPVREESPREMIFQYLDEHLDLFELTDREINKNLYDKFPDSEKTSLRVYKKQYLEMKETEKEDHVTVKRKSHRKIVKKSSQDEVDEDKNITDKKTTNIRKENEDNPKDGTNIKNKTMSGSVPSPSSLIQNMLSNIIVRLDKIEQSRQTVSGQKTVLNAPQHVNIPEGMEMFHLRVRNETIMEIVQVLSGMIVKG